ncbi:MAG: extracellular solute-binding protein [Clostridia bacterium]|nr:extracellular solute-binding protein [Clostridia bacterium]
MKTFKRILALTLAAAMVVCMSACSLKKKTNGNYDLTVSYYSGAYGDDWIKLAAEEFGKEKGVNVQVIPSADMDCNAENSLTSGKNLSDLYMISSNRWQSWVQNGYVENLSSVFDATVTTSKGEVKVSDYLDSDVIGRYYIERQLGTGDSYPWVMPFSAMPMSLAYNYGVLTKIPHVSATAVSAKSVDPSTGKWIAPPENLTEWLALCDDINAYKSDDSHKYVPFGWTANAAQQVYYFIFTWWAQYQGLNESNVPGQGCFYDFWNFGNTSKTTMNQTVSSNVFDQKGIANALDGFKKLVVDTKTQGYKNSLSAVNTLTTEELTRALYAERNEERPVIAMASSFGESEARLTGVLDSDSDGKSDSDIRFMNIPALDGHESEKYLYCASDDFLFVPSAAEHKDLAKEFITFLCSEDQLKKFTVRSGGGIRPFNYDAREIEDSSLTEYNKSVFDVYYNSTKIYDFPLKAYKESPFGVSLIYTYKSPIAFAEVSPATVINMIKKTDGAEIMKEAKRTFGLSISKYVKDYRMTEIK